ncbi:MAG: hypothetical protein HFJ48_02745 [Clostridia bacterium]|nr:hypothetical protein [Clostridia bacterium]
MIFESNYKIDIRDITIDNKVTNKAILEYMENTACRHSDEVGYGILNIPKTKRVWLLLDWKFKMIERLEYSEEINIKTWSKGMEKCYAYRDFEVYNKEGKVVAIASSKWVLMDSENLKIIKADETIRNSYNEEKERKVFEKTDLEKIKEPEQYEKEFICRTRKTDIDVNGHVHNLSYLDVAYEILPYNLQKCQQFENVRITYKKEIKPDTEIKVKYAKENDKEIVVIKDKDDVHIHSIIELW